MFGSKTLYVSHMPMFTVEEHMYQVILRVTLPDAVMRGYRARQGPGRKPWNLVNSERQYTLPQLKAGTLRGLATTSAKRVGALPDVPTLTETGLAAYEAEVFYGVVAPAKTPPDTLKALSAWFLAALTAPETQPRLAEQGLFPVGTCGTPFGDFLRNIVADYERVIRDSDIKAN